MFGGHFLKNENHLKSTKINISPVQKKIQYHSGLLKKFPNSYRYYLRVETHWIASGTSSLMMQPKPHMSYLAPDGSENTEAEIGGQKSNK